MEKWWRPTWEGMEELNRYYLWACIAMPRCHMLHTSCLAAVRGRPALQKWSWSRWGMRQSHLSCDMSSYYNGTWSTASSVCTMQLSPSRLGLLLSSLDTNSLPAADAGQKSLQQFQLIGCSHLAWIPISWPSQYCYCELGRRVFTDTLIKIINVLRHQIFPLINPKDY